MIKKSSFPKVLLLLAAFVFFTANTVHILEVANAELLASDNPTYHFDFDTAKKKGPYLNLKSAILVNYENGQVLYSKNVNEVRPIASITLTATTSAIIAPINKSRPTPAIRTPNFAKSGLASRFEGVVISAVCCTPSSAADINHLPTRSRVGLSRAT